MYKFGRRPPTGLDSYGVSGALAKNAEVCYHALFDTRAVGQISDLLAARLREFKIDEVNLRTFLMISILYAYSDQLSNKNLNNPNSKTGSDTLDDPVLIECGIDDEKVAISVLFTLNLNVFLNTEGLAERVSKKEPLDPFEQILTDLYKYSDQVIIRFQPETRKTEFVMLLGIPESIDAKYLVNKQNLETIVFETQIVPEAPRPTIYRELGDVNYSNFLGVNVRGQTFEDSPSPSGNFSSSGSSSPGDNVAQINGEGTEELSQTISGSGDEIDQASQTVAGQTEEFNSDSLLVRGTPQASDDALAYIEGSSSFFGKIASSFRRLFSGESNENREEENLLNSELSFSVEDLNRQAPTKKTKKEKKGSGDPDEPDLDFIDHELNELNELDAHFSTEKKRSGSELAEGMFEGLVHERAQAAQMTKEMQQLLKSKETEFEGRVEALNAELRRKDSQIARSSSALSRAKDQMIQLAKSLDKYKRMAATNAAGNQFKVKYETTQRLLELSQSEGAALSKKVEDLKSEINSLKLVQPQQESGAELMALQAKYERLRRQAEEFKKANRQLIEQFGESKKGISARNTSGKLVEMQDRLDAAMRMAMTSKKEADNMKVRISELVKLEVELKTEVAVLRDRLNSSKVA